MQEALSKEELDERIAILRRFRSLLEQQRDKFRAYLRVLELQEPQITGDDAALLNEHTELGSLLVHDIGELQKVIVPMQALYRSRHAAACSPAEAVPVEQLQEELDRLSPRTNATSSCCAPACRKYAGNLPSSKIPTVHTSRSTPKKTAAALLYI